MKVFSAVVTEAVTGTSFYLPVRQNGSLGGSFALVATATTANPVTVLVEHSPDGLTWFTLVTFTNITADTTEFKALETQRFSSLRIRVSAFTGTTVTLNVFAE